MSHSEYPSPVTSGTYRIIEESDGFHVEGANRHPVFVRLSPQRTALLVGSQRYQDSYCPYQLFAFRALLDAVVEILLRDWVRPADHPNDWSGVHAWVRAQTGRALNHRIHQQWQRLLAVVPEAQRDVARAVFAATFPSTQFGCEAWPELYEQPFLVQDVIRYRASAIACHYALPMAQSLIAYQPVPCERWLDVIVPFDPNESVHRTALIDALARDWSLLYTHRAKPGGSLRKTLMQLPGNVPASLLSHLHTIEPMLQRPVTDRVELLLLLIFGRSGAALDSWEVPFFAKATRKDILSALRLLAAHLQRDLRPTSVDIALLVSYIYDYCRACDREQLPTHPLTGNLIGLLKKAMVWHREQHEQELKRLLARYSSDRATARPPIPLPDNLAVTFLATVGDIYQEGLSMGHCIAGYTENALQGTYYLFHVCYQGTEASVQVHCTGEVLQSFGPHNRVNVAATYGKRVLARWGNQLKRKEQGDEYAFPRLLLPAGPEDGAGHPF